MKEFRLDLTVLAVITTFSALRIVSGAGDGQRGTQRGTFRVSVMKLLDEEDIIVAQIEIEAMPGCYVEVASDKPDRGGVGAATPEPSPTDRSPRTRLTIVGDHVVGGAGTTDALKFLMRMTGGSGTAAMTNTGPIPRGKRLSETVSVLIEPGEYSYGEATRLVRFQDVTYSLIVKTRK
ncbi:MAG: hypothetical protein U0790_18325 [Isosphaeraceae bacterium]